MFKKIFLCALAMIGICLTTYNSDAIKAKLEPNIVEAKEFGGRKKETELPGNLEEDGIFNGLSVVKTRAGGLDTFRVKASFKRNIRECGIKSYDTDIKSVGVNGNVANFTFAPVNKVASYVLKANITRTLVVSYKFYSYFYNNNFYFSRKSLDDAWYNALSQDFLSGNVTEEEVEKDYIEFSSSIFKGSSEKIISNTVTNNKKMSKSSNTSYVHVKLKWKDKNKLVLPLVGVKVELYDSIFNSKINLPMLGNGTTNANGEVTIAFENSYEWLGLGGTRDPFVRVLAAGNTFNVAREWLFSGLSVYDAYSEIHCDIGFGETVNFELTIDCNDESSDAQQAFSVAQGLVYTERVALRNVNNTVGYAMLDNKIKVMYPASTQTSFDYVGYCGILRDDHHNWRAIAHEYGHFVESRAGAYDIDLVTILLNNPSHTPDNNNFVEKWEKSYALKLTWTEAWAEAFAIICYHEEPGFKTSNDSDEMKSRSISYPNAYKDISENWGEAQEKSVINYLLDLYDEYDNNDPTDNICLGAEGFFEETLKDTIDTLQDFVNSFNSLNANLNNGYLLEKTHIAPGNLVLSDENYSLETAPSFTFVPNGCKAYPNDQFEIVFFSNGSEICRTQTFNKPNSVGYTDTMSYTLTQSEWTNLLNVCMSDSCYAVVQGYQAEDRLFDGDIDTGPYQSAPILINLPVRYNTTIDFSDGSGCYFEYVELFEGRVAHYRINVPYSTELILTTGSMKDTVIAVYDSYGNLIHEDDDGGIGNNAFEAVNVIDGGVYLVDLRLYNLSENESLAFYAFTSNGSFQYDKETFAILDGYNYFETIRNDSNYTKTFEMEMNSCYMFVYIPEVTGWYTCEGTCDGWSYLYIIDCSFSLPADSGMYYGAGEELLCGNLLRAGRPYFICMTRENNSVPFSNGETTFTSTVHLECVEQYEVYY